MDELEDLNSILDDYDEFGDELDNSVDSDENIPENNSEAPYQRKPASELIPDGPVDELFNEFDDNYSGDPFRSIQAASRKFGDKFKGIEEGTGGLYDPSKEADRLFSRLADRILKAAPTINSQQGRLNNLTISSQIDGFRPTRAGQVGSAGLTTGFVGRAGVSEYTNLINQPGKLTGSFFQLQQHQLISALTNRKGGFELVTQGLSVSGSSSTEELRSTASILAGNELSARVGRAIQTRDNLDRNPISTIKSFASFHPKIGFVGDRERGGTAFIGTQNLTPALTGNNSLETLMSFSMMPGGRNLSTEVSAAAQTESAIATEILEMTEAITGLVSPGRVYAPGGIQKELKKRGTRRAYLYTESEIYGRVSKALSTAAFDSRSVTARDRVVISMGEISMLLKKNGYASEMATSVKKLATERRLTIITDQRKVEDILDGYRDDPKGSTRINADMLHTLVKFGAIKTAATGYQHDKTIAIFSGSTNNLRFLSTGSANLSADSMMPVGMIPNSTDEYFSGSLQTMRRTLGDTQYDTNSPMNADTILALGFGAYADDSRSIKSGSVQEYLGKLDKDGAIGKYYNDLAGGSLFKGLDGKLGSNSSTGFMAERSSDESKVEELKKAIDNLAKQFGSAIEVKGRYDLGKLGSNGLAKLTGVTVRVRDVDGISFKDAKVNLTVDDSGTVIVSDSNRVLTGSLFLNKSTGTLNIAGKSVASGGSLNLSSLDTAVGLIGTMVREMSYNARFSSIGDVFSVYAQRNQKEIEGLARDYLATSISGLVPEIESVSGVKKVGLSSILDAINDSSLVKGSSNAVLDQVQRNLESGTNNKIKLASDLNPDETLVRKKALTDVVSVLRDRSARASNSDNEVSAALDRYQKSTRELAGLPKESTNYNESSAKAGKLLSQILLADDLGIFNDVKFEILNKSIAGKANLAKTQSVQASRLVGDVLAPFLASHELGHSANQAKYRRPVYAESEVVTGASLYNRAIKAGFLNPAAVSASTKAGAPGEFIALVGASSHGKPLRTVGYGGVRQMTTVDTDLNSGAAIRYDTDGTFSSTAGLTLLTPKSNKDQSRKLMELMGQSFEESELDLLEDTIYFMPFNKAEQISQRLKNTQGGRPTIDISPEFSKAVRRMSTNIKTDKSGDITNGRIRESLPKEQFESLRTAVEIFKGDEDKVTEYFREKTLKTTNTENGVIGPASLKRVAMIGGFSLIGDTGYVNAGYQQDVGYVHTMSVSLASSKLTDQANTEAVLKKYMQKGNIIVYAPYRPEGAEAIDREISDLASDLGLFSDVNQLETLLKTYKDGKFENYFLKKEGGKLKSYMREGLYSLESNATGFVGDVALGSKSYKRLGGFNKDGTVTVSGASSVQENFWGSINEPINLKFPGFGKRHEEGIGYVQTIPSVVVQNGKMTATTNVLPIYRPGSNSRNVGMGLHKGPWEATEAQAFEDIEANLSDRLASDPTGTYAKLQPEERDSRIYGMFSPGHFKGFNFETGVSLLKDPKSRAGLTSLTGDQIATSLSILFLSDSSSDGLASALKENLNKKGLGFAAGAFEMASKVTKDYSDSSKSLGKVAQGLTILAEGEGSKTGAIAGDLNPLKQTLIRALQGEDKALTHLATQANKLVSTVVNDPSTSVKFGDKVASIYEGSAIARGAGLLAHTAFITGQIISINPGSSLGNIFQLNIGDTSRYLTNTAYKNKVDVAAAKAGILMPVNYGDSSRYESELQNKLALFQAYNANEVLIDDYKDTTASRTLVPTGLQDTVSLEYQYMLGLSTKYMKAFEGVDGGSKKSKALKNAFGILAGAGVGLRGISPDTHLSYQIAVPSGENGFMGKASIDTQKLVLSYTGLADSLGLYSTAMSELAMGDSTGVNRLSRIQQLSKGVLDKGVDSIEARAVALSKTNSLFYFHDKSDSLGLAQNKRLILEMGLYEHADKAQPERVLTPKELVGRVIANSFDNYLLEKQDQAELGNNVNKTYDQYVDEVGGPVKALEDRYQVVSELTKKGGALSNVNSAVDAHVISQKIEAQITKLNDLSMSAIRETYNTNSESDFLKGSLEAETRLEALALQSPDNSNKYSQILNEIKQTKQVVLPKIQFTEITEGEDAGRFSTRVLRPEDAEATQGVLLGTDVMRHLAMKFPGHIGDALKHQASLRNQFISTEELRGKVFNNGGKAIVDASEIEAYMQLETTMESSRLSFLKMAETDTIRQAFGDKLKYQGAVGSAIGSFVLDSTEVGIGSRYLSVTEASLAARTLSNQFDALKQLPTSEQGFRTIDATRKLVEAIGLKGPTTEREERLSGIASKATVLEAFDQLKNKKGNGRFTTQDVVDVENLAYSSLSNTSVESVKQMRKSGDRTLDKLINTGLSSMRRGGAPAGVSGPVNENLVSETVGIDEVRNRVKREGGVLIPDAARSKTAMFAPMVGRMMTMLGDFDGDAYQLLMSGVGSHLESAANIQNLVKDDTESLIRLEAERTGLVALSDTDGVVSINEQIEQTTNRLGVRQDQLIGAFSKLNERQLKYDKIQLEALSDVRNWVGGHLSLPDHVVEDTQVTTGQMMTFVQQMGGMLGHIEDASPFIKHTENRLELIKNVFDSREGFKFSKAAIDGSSENVEFILDVVENRGLIQSGEERESVRSDLTGIMGQARKENVGNLNEFIDTSRNYLALQGNLAATIASSNKTFDKASGTVLTAAEFEGLQSTVGQSGTDLIGKVYNSFIPLLDKAMGEHSIAVALNATGESSFSSLMGDRLETLINDKTLDADKREAAASLKFKLVDQRVETIKKTQKRVEGTSATLGALQQVIRDALKEKSPTGMVGMLKEASFDGMTLIDKMESVDSSDPLKADKERLGILSSVVETRIGHDLSNLHGSDPGVTGFGALLMFASVSKTDDNQVFNKLIDGKGLNKQYSSALKDPNSGINNPVDFVLDRALSLIEITQAKFKAGNFTDDGRAAYVSSMERQFEGKTLDSVTGAHNKEHYKLVRSYQSGEIDDVGLVEKITLSEVRKSNKKDGVLTLGRLQELRGIYSESQKVRYKEGSIEERADTLNADTHNAIVRMFQRGQHPSHTDTLYMKSSQLDLMSQALDERGVDPSKVRKAQIGEAARILNLTIGDSSLEQAMFTQALFMDDKFGKNGFNALKKSTAATIHSMGMMEQLYEESASEKPDMNRTDVITRKLSSIIEDGRPSVDRYERMRSKTGATRAEASKSKVNSVMNKVTGKSKVGTDQTRANRTVTLLDPDAGLEAVGAFAVPALMIAFGSGASLDDRIGLAALDTFQSIAYMSSDSSRRSTEFMEGDSSGKANFRYTGARIRDAMENEGVASGAAQGIVQEGIFRGSSQLIYKGIDGLNKKLGTNKRKAGNAVATIVAETISTVAALGFARGRVKARSDAGTEAPDRISDILKGFAEDVWKSVEAAQLALSDPSYEVIDTEFNQTMDFDTDLSELEKDVMTGLVVLDEDGKSLDIVFDTDQNTEAALVSSF